MRLLAVTAGSLLELEQADERLRRMIRPAKLFKLVIDAAGLLVV
jgi:hypothetical protein